MLDMATSMRHKAVSCRLQRYNNALVHDRGNVLCVPWAAIEMRVVRDNDRLIAQIAICGSIVIQLLAK